MSSFIETPVLDASPVRYINLETRKRYVMKIKMDGSFVFLIGDFYDVYCRGSDKDDELIYKRLTDRNEVYANGGGARFPEYKCKTEMKECNKYWPNKHNNIYYLSFLYVKEINIRDTMKNHEIIIKKSSSPPLKPRGSPNPLSSYIFTVRHGIIEQNVTFYPLENFEHRIGNSMERKQKTVDSILESNIEGDVHTVKELIGQFLGVKKEGKKEGKKGGKTKKQKKQKKQKTYNNRGRTIKYNYK